MGRVTPGYRARNSIMSCSPSPGLTLTCLWTEGAPLRSPVNHIDCSLWSTLSVYYSLGPSLSSAHNLTLSKMIPLDLLVEVFLSSITPASIFSYIGAAVLSIIAYLPITLLGLPEAGGWNIQNTLLVHRPRHIYCLIYACLLLRFITEGWRLYLDPGTVYLMQLY